MIILVFLLTVVYLFYVIGRIHKVATSPTWSTRINFPTLSDLEKDIDFKEMEEFIFCGQPYYQEIDDFFSDYKDQLMKDKYVDIIVGEKIFKKENAIIKNHFCANLAEIKVKNKEKQVVFCFYYTTITTPDDYIIMYRMGLGKDFNTFDKLVDIKKKKFLFDPNEYKSIYQFLKNSYIKKNFKTSYEMIDAMADGMIIPVWDFPVYVKLTCRSFYGNDVSDECFREYVYGDFLNQIQLDVEGILEDLNKANAKLLNREKEQINTLFTRILTRKAIMEMI